mgnify:CR=1 FL=1
MLFVPPIEECIDFARLIGAKNILEVLISPSETSKIFQCHKNCEYNPVLGYYFVKDSHGILHAYKHSVLNLGDKLIDNTPTLDERTYNIFAYPSDYNEEILTYHEGSVYINKVNIQETEHMYYVYGLIDPRNNKPFYIGKGCKKRAWSKHHGYVRVPTNPNMILILAAGLDRYEANDMEIRLIRYYGRKDQNTGILINLTNGGEGTYGVIRTEEYKRKMSKAKKGKAPWNKGKKGSQVPWNKGIERPKKVCPHCGKSGGDGNMQRWHFDNCKFKNTL